MYYDFSVTPKTSIFSSLPRNSNETWRAYSLVSGQNVRLFILSSFLHYMGYLKQDIVEGAESWMSRVLCTPLDMFLNFLYQSGFYPSDPVRVG